MTLTDPVVDKRLLRRQDAVTRYGMTPEQFAAGYRHLGGTAFLERGAILAPTERIVATWHSAGGAPIVAGMAATIMHGSKWFDADFTVELIRHVTGCNKPGRGSRVHRTDDLCDADIVTIDGIPVTGVIRTAFDVGRVGPPWRRLGYLDALHRATGFSIEELALYTANRKRRRGIRQLRELIPLINGLAESPPESWVRLLMIRADLPTPDLQVEVADEETGQIFARIDLAYEALKIAIEYDGEEFHSTDEQRAYDELREARLRAMGWEIIRINREQISTRPWSIINDITRALRSRGGYF